MSKKIHTHEGGYVLFLSVIVSTIILTLGTLIAGFVRQDLILAGASEQSDVAFYAATSGLNCGRFYDLQDSFSINGAPPSSSVTCFGVTPIRSGTRSSGDVQHYEYTWTTTSGQTICTVLQVVKNTSSGSLTTRMIARGYNVSCATRTVGTNVVERIIDVNY